MSAMEPNIRLSTEDAIERLVALLDALEGDFDLEDGADDEPEPLEPYVAGWVGSTDDLEDDTAHYDMPGYILGGQGL